MRRLMKTLAFVAIGLALAMSTLSLPIAVRGATIGDSPAKAQSITLYGSFSAPAGWGWATTNITEPGPTLTVRQGDVITFHLFSQDGATNGGHILVIDVNNNTVRDTPDQASVTFSSATVATDFMFTASTAGAFNYFCGVHGYAAQHGLLVVQATGGGGAPTGGMDTTLLIGGVVIAVAIVAVVAAIVMRRKKP